MHTKMVDTLANDTARLYRPSIFIGIMVNVTRFDYSYVQTKGQAIV